MESNFHEEYPPTDFDTNIATTVATKSIDMQMESTYSPIHRESN